jgi:probable DNA metabolism protein
MNIIYLYDGTLEGMLTAIFQAFARKEDPANITTEQNLQHSLLESYVPIHTCEEEALRVQAGILETLGNQCYENVKRVFLSEEEAKGGVLLRYLQYTMRAGKRACWHLANPAVDEFEQILRVVGNEAHYMLQFARFAQVEGGVYYARIEPKASVVPLIMDHFAARFNIQPFMIHDARHGLAGVFDTEKWWLVEANDVNLPANTQLQDGFEALWQTFYDVIAIEERRNPTCRRNFMPKRFWGNMCEMTPAALRKHSPSTQTPTQAVKSLPQKRKAELPQGYS